LIDVLTQLLPFIGYPRTLNGLRAIDEVVAAVFTHCIGFLNARYVTRSPRQ
jgi:hypothetical protein